MTTLLQGPHVQDAGVLTKKNLMLMGHDRYGLSKAAESWTKSRSNYVCMATTRPWNIKVATFEFQFG